MNEASTENKILHKKEIIFVDLTNSRKHLIINTIDKVIKIFPIKDLGTHRSRFDRSFMNTKNLLVSNDEKIVYALGIEKLTNEEFEEGIVEAFDIVDKKKLFSKKRLENEFVEHHGFGLANDYLLIFTNKLCFKMNRDGDILGKYELPHRWPYDILTQVVFQNDLVVASYFGSSNVLFFTNNKEFAYYDFKDYFVRGDTIFLSSSNILLSMRKDFKNNFNEDTSNWKLVEFNTETIEVVKKVRINKALKLFGTSDDGNFVYGFCYNHLYCLDMQNETLVFALQHYVSIYSAFLLLDDKQILSSSKGNYICIYNTDRGTNNEDYDPFFGSNSRGANFMMDEFSSRCPLVLAYDIFEKNGKEIYLLYDIIKEKIVKKFVLTESNDFNPLNLISTKAKFKFTKFKIYEI